MSFQEASMACWLPAKRAPGPPLHHCNKALHRVREPASGLLSVSATPSLSTSTSFVFWVTRSRLRRSMTSG
eukprot:5533336-Pyramimonas_sp.AAC.1